MYSTCYSQVRSPHVLLFSLPIVKPPELIESQELNYPDCDYRVGQLEAPDPIIQQSPPASGVASGRGESPQRHSAGGVQQEAVFSEARGGNKSCWHW